MEFLSFTKSYEQKYQKNINKNLSSKYSPGMLVTRQTLLDHAKQSTTDVLKTA